MSSLVDTRPSMVAPPASNGAPAETGDAVNGSEASAPAPDSAADQIQAYARLEFAAAEGDGQMADFYVAQLDVIIGRRPPLELNHATLSPSLAHPTSATRSTSPGADEEPSPLLLPTTRASLLDLRKPDPSTDVRVDLDLGPIKAVSRQHARLYFDYTTAAWALDVLGRNGVVVDGRWRAKGEKAILHHRAKIQIAERIFYFVLPNGVAPSEAIARHTRNQLPNESSSDGEISPSQVEMAHSSDYADASEEEKPRRRPSAPAASARIARTASSSSAAPTPAPAPKKRTAAKRLIDEIEPDLLLAPGPPPKRQAAKTAAAALRTPAGENGTARKQKRTGKAKAAESDDDGDPDAEAPRRVTVSNASLVKKTPLSLPRPDRLPSNPYIGKPDKPPFSPPNLIAQAIVHASINGAPVTRAEIIAWLSGAYPFFARPVVIKELPARPDIARSPLICQIYVRFVLLTCPQFERTVRTPNRPNRWRLRAEAAMRFDGSIMHTTSQRRLAIYSTIAPNAPAIARRGDAIVISAAIFSDLTAAQLEQLSILEASRAVQVLQAYARKRGVPMPVLVKTEPAA